MHAWRDVGAMDIVASEGCAAAVNEALDRVLASEPFQRSPRQRKFLSLLAEQALLGTGDPIKEYTLAVTLFGRRASSFDAQRDSIVRVEAGRLREKLARYYAREGADARLRIAMPKGRYRLVVYEVPVALYGRGGLRSLPFEHDGADVAPRRRATDTVGFGGTGGTLDPFAQDCYDRGRCAARVGDQHSRTKAIQLLRRAVGSDDQFARAHAALASSLLNEGWFAAQRSEAVVAEALAAARRAIFIDPTSAEAISVIATLEHRIERNWRKAEQTFASGRALGASSPAFHCALGLAYAARGGSSEAASHVLRARELEPLDLDVQLAFGQVLYYARRYREAATQLAALLEIAPRHGLAHLALGFSELYAGRPLDALRAFARSSVLLPGHASPQLGAAAAMAREGFPREARAHVDWVLERFSHAYHSRYHLAIAHAYLGEIDHVFAALAEAAKLNDFLLASLPVEPAFDGCRADKRFTLALSDYSLATPRELLQPMT